jgi:hypothetical protein
VLPIDCALLRIGAYATLIGMKHLGLICGAALFACALPAHADDATMAVKIEELLKVTHADQLVEQTMKQLQPMMEAQLKTLNLPDDAKSAADEFQKRMLGWLQERLSYEKLKPMYLKIYGEALTEEEISGMIAFYQTPAGQAVIKKMPLIMQKTMTFMQGMMSDMIPEMTKITEELEQKYKKK